MKGLPVCHQTPLKCSFLPPKQNHIIKFPFCRKPFALYGNTSRSRSGDHVSRAYTYLGAPCGIHEFLTCHAECFYINNKVEGIKRKRCLRFRNLGAGTPLLCNRAVRQGAAQWSSPGKLSLEGQAQGKALIMHNRGRWREPAPFNAQHTVVV